MANSNGMQVLMRGDQFSQRDLNNIDLQDTQLIPVRGRKRSPKRRKLLIGVLLLLFLAGTITPVVGNLIYHTYDTRYQTDLSLAQNGTQHLQKAESLLATWSQKLLDTQITNQAKIEFASAFKNFDLLNSDLTTLPGLIKQVPTYGARLNSALRLVPLARTLSQAGVTGCSILNILTMGLHDPLTPHAHSITQSDIVVINQNVKELKSELVVASQQVNQLQPDDLKFNSRLPKLVNTFHKDLPVIQGWINTIQQLLPVAPTLLGIGTSTNYLIEILDSTELRPAGGFIGNYGIASLSGGRLSSAHITDVNLLDRPFEAAGHAIPYPAAYKWFDLAPRSWGFRDSNLDADFPTAAHYGEQNYLKEGGKVPIQGVIAITPALIEHALAITGPIAVPEYQETVTAQNLITRIHFHQLGGIAADEGSGFISSPDGHSSMRKRFTELLSEHFLARVRQLSSSDLSKFLLLMANAVRSKDLQLYFNSSIAENLLHSYHLDAAIQSPIGDGLFVVDANISGNKANSAINYTLDDQVTINSQGDIIHHTNLHYTWAVGQNYGNSLYRDYVHIYVPPGSILLIQDGWHPRGASNVSNREVWMGYFEFSQGQSLTINLVWKVRLAVSKVQNGWHYQYVIQRQAGALRKINFQLLLPSCATATNMWGGLISHSRQDARLTQTLDKDLNVGVDYICK